MITATLLVLLAVPSAPLQPSPLDEKLLRPIEVAWQLRPLEDGARELAREHELNVVIDSRLDRQFMVTGNPRGIALEEVLDMLAKLVSGRAVAMGEVVFIGHSSSADRAATHAELERSKLAETPLARKLEERVSLAWTGEQSLAELVAPLAERLGLRLAGAEKLSLRPKPDALNEVAVLDALFVLLAQADQTIRIDEAAKALEVVDLPAKPVLERSLKTNPSSTRASVQEYQAVVPEMEIAAKPGKLTLRGSWLDLRALDRHLGKAERLQALAKANKGKPSKRTTRDVYTLTMRNTTLQKFADNVSKVAGKQVVLDEESLKAAGKSPLTRLSCSVTNGSLEDLLDVALKPLGLEYSIAGNRINIRAGAQ